MNRKLFLSFVGMLSSVTLLQAATNYVATTGNDTNSGSFASPFLTIQKAVDVALTGGVILVGPGTYATGENTSASATYGRSRVAITRNITVRSLQGAERTIILGQAHPSATGSGGDSIRCVVMTEGVLDGFTLKDGYADTSKNNGNMDDPIINGGGVCVPVGFSTPVINNCIITGCSAYRGAAAYHGTLNNCTLVNNKSVAPVGVILGCVWSTTLNNSIIRFNVPEDFASSSTTDESKFSYCCLPSLPGNSYGGLVRNIAGNITANPEFQAGTFIPKRGSPCIDKGSNTYTNGTQDAAGLTRVHNLIVDIGAYEVSFLPYTLTVVNGQGSGTYTNGDVVPISFTNSRSQWVSFTGWTGDTNTVANVTATQTTLVMPSRATTVTANYQVLAPIDEIISKVLDIPLPIATSNVTVFSVNSAVPSVTLGGITNNDSAFFETVFTNAGTVTFSWKVSSEARYDFLNFYVDGNRKAQISGTNVSGIVTQFVSNIGSGLTNEAHRLKWEYSKDKSYSKGADQGEVGPILWIPNDLATELGVPGTNSTPAALSLPYGQPGLMLPFPYGFQVCFLDQNPPSNGLIGGNAVKLGGLVGGVPFLPDSQSTGVEVVLHGVGTLKFNCYTDCDTDDKLVCSVDGVERFSWSENKDGAWSNDIIIEVTGNMPHRVRWSYIKGGTSWQSGYLDAVWINNVIWARTPCTLMVGGGSGSGTYFVGDTATIVATNVTATQVFDYWSGDVANVTDVNSITTTVCMVSDTTVLANYKNKYTLIVEDGTGSGDYFGGQTVSVAATIPTGMVFIAWSGDTEYLADPDNAAATFLMPERDISIKANFAVAPYVVAVFNGWEAGSWPNAVHEGWGDPQGSYVAGAEVRIVANPAPLWKIFDYWTNSIPGVAISNATAEITSFTMPSNSVSLTAMYRDQRPDERLAGALTIRDQPLLISSFSSNGVVAVSSGGVRYDDPVVQFGGPSVGAGQSVSLTITNLLGGGTLLFWWRGDTEADADGIEVLEDGISVPAFYSEKSTNTLDHTLWYLSTYNITPTNSVTFRYSRDNSYMVHDNIMLMDRVTWIPNEISVALNASGVPNINQEFDPCFNFHPKQQTGLDAFSGEDGGVRWDTTVPGGAIKIGNFGYVTNNQIAQVGFRLYPSAGGIFIWDWKTESESTHDRLEFLLDLIPTNSISGKNIGWTTETFVLTSPYARSPESPITDPNVTWPVFGFRYKKDYDQSFLNDAGWVRAGVWYPSYAVSVTGGYITNVNLNALNPAFATNPDVLDQVSKGIIPAGTPFTIIAYPPALTGSVFKTWSGILGGVITNTTSATQEVTMARQPISITANYDPPSAPAYSSAPQIKNFMISETPTPSKKGMFDVASESEPALGNTVTMTFEGSSLQGVYVEWSDSLSAPIWTKLSIEEIGVPQKLPDGNTRWELKAMAPSTSPQGFFRLGKTK